jgi:ribosomal protein L29
MSDLYQRDFHAWAAEQANLLRQGDLAAADLAHLIEELEQMGHSTEDQLVNRLGILLAHLLKWRYQPSHRGNSWRLTIAEQRRRIARLMRRNPSLKHVLPEALADAYGDAILLAQRETGLPEAAFPADCPFSFADALEGPLDE